MQTGKMLLLTFPVFFFSFYCFGFSFQSHAFDEIIKNTVAIECLVSITNMRKMFFCISSDFCYDVQYVVSIGHS